MRYRKDYELERIAKRHIIYLIAEMFVAAIIDSYKIVSYTERLGGVTHADLAIAILLGVICIIIPIYILIWNIALLVRRKIRFCLANIIVDVSGSLIFCPLTLFAIGLYLI